MAEDVEVFTALLNAHAILRSLQDVNLFRVGQSKVGIGRAAIGAAAEDTRVCGGRYVVQFAPELSAYARETEGFAPRCH